MGEEIHDLKVLERDDRYQVFVGDSVYNLTARLDDDYLQAVINGHRINHQKLKPTGRLAGNMYCYTPDTFEMVRPVYDPAKEIPVSR